MLKVEGTKSDMKAPQSGTASCGNRGNARVLDVDELLQVYSDCQLTPHVSMQEFHLL